MQCLLLCYLNPPPKANLSLSPPGNDRQFFFEEIQRASDSYSYSVPNVSACVMQCISSLHLLLWFQLALIYSISVIITIDHRDMCLAFAGSGLYT